MNCFLIMTAQYCVHAWVSILDLAVVVVLEAMSDIAV